MLKLTESAKQIAKSLDQNVFWWEKNPLITWCFWHFISTVPYTKLFLNHQGRLSASRLLFTFRLVSTVYCRAQIQFVIKKLKNLVIVDLWLCNGSSCLDVWVHIEGSEQPNPNVLFFYFYTTVPGAKAIYQNTFKPYRCIFFYLEKNHPFLFTRNE